MPQHQDNPRQDGPKQAAPAVRLPEAVANTQLPVNQIFCMPADDVRFCPVRKGQLILIDAGREKLGQVASSPCSDHNGLWQIGDNNYVGPVGHISVTPYGGVNLDEPIGSLLAVISTVEPSTVVPSTDTKNVWNKIFSKQSVGVGTGYRTIAEKDGFLYLCINDGPSDLKDNKGGVPVRVTIKESSAY